MDRHFVLGFAGLTKISTLVTLQRYLSSMFLQLLVQLGAHILLLLQVCTVYEVFRMLSHHITVS